MRWNFRGNFSLKPLGNCSKLAASLLGVQESSEVSLGALCCLNLSRMVIGTVFVAFVTALPELLSSMFAEVLGSSHIALGNIIGSTIYNIPLIIGICGLVGGGLKIKSSSTSNECIFMMGLTFLITLLAITHIVTWWIGAVFVAFYPVLYSTLSAMGPAVPRRGTENLSAVLGT